MTSAAPIATRHGNFFAQFNGIGLSRLDFPFKARAPKPASKPTGEAKHWLAATAAALESLLLGRAPSRLPPLDISAGTEFQQTVWAELLNIPSGQTRSYGEIAGRLAKPGAARAVGSLRSQPDPGHRSVPPGAGSTSADWGFLRWPRLEAAPSPYRAGRFCRLRMGMAVQPSATTRALGTGRPNIVLSGPLSRT